MEEELLSRVGWQSRKVSFSMSATTVRVKNEIADPTLFLMYGYISPSTYNRYCANIYYHNKYHDSIMETTRCFQ